MFALARLPTRVMSVLIGYRNEQRQRDFGLIFKIPSVISVHRLINMYLNHIVFPEDEAMCLILQFINSASHASFA